MKEPVAYQEIGSLNFALQEFFNCEGTATISSASLAQIKNVSSSPMALRCPKTSFTNRQAFPRGSVPLPCCEAILLLREGGSAAAVKFCICREEERKRVHEYERCGEHVFRKLCSRECFPILHGPSSAQDRDQRNKSQALISGGIAFAFKRIA